MPLPMSYPGSGGKVYTMGMGVFAYLRCFLVDANYKDSFFLIGYGMGKVKCESEV
jgi:hypothetical protein